jgi:cytochrome c oxidase subunit 2
MEPDPKEPDTTGARARANVTSGTLIRVIVISGVATALGIALGLSINWFPQAASKQAGPIDTLWDVLLICSVPIFVIVCAVVLTSIVKFRMRPGEEELDGPPIHGKTKLEVVWTTIPALLLLGLCTYAYLVLHDIEKAPAHGASNAPEIRVAVTGQQFAWSFAYATDARGRRIAPAKQVKSAQLYLPLGQSVEFDVRSVDVLHDFWVPDFRMKIDAVPGIVTHYRVTPTKLGRHPIVCAELCGLGHAFMRNTAHVVPRAQFPRLLAKMAVAQHIVTGGTAGGGGPNLAAGKTVFTGVGGCGACHTLADANTTGAIGPDLDKYLKSRDKAFIHKSIVDPQAYVEKGFPANTMPPNFASTLSKDQIDAVVNYLYTVTH